MFEFCAECETESGIGKQNNRFSAPLADGRNWQRELGNDAESQEEMVVAFVW